jgi:hypothetical protein
MNKEELEDFTKKEVIDILVDLVNKMDLDGNACLKKWEDCGSLIGDIEIYAYGAALVTKVNYVKIKVAFKDGQKYNQIIDEAYENYEKEYEKGSHLEGTGLLWMTKESKETFIYRAKTDKEFSERWGLKIG